MIIEHRLHDDSRTVKFETNYPAKIAIEAAGHRNKTPELVTWFLNQVQPDPKLWSDAAKWSVDARNAALFTLFCHREKSRLKTTINFNCPVCGEEHAVEHNWKNTLEKELFIEGKPERLVRDYTVKPLTGEHETELYNLQDSISFLSASLQSSITQYQKHHIGNLKAIQSTADEIQKLRLQKRLYKIASALEIKVEQLPLNDFQELEGEVKEALDDMRHGFDYSIEFDCGGEVCRIELPFPSSFALPEI